MEKKVKYQVFDNYPEAKLALGKVAFPAVIKPYQCDDVRLHYKVNNYGEAAQALYSAFEYSKNSCVVIESF